MAHRSAAAGFADRHIRSQAWSAALARYAIAQNSDNREVIASWEDAWQPLADGACDGLSSVFADAPIQLTLHQYVSKSPRHRRSSGHPGPIDSGRWIPCGRMAHPRAGVIRTSLSASSSTLCAALDVQNSAGRSAVVRRCGNPTSAAPLPASL